MPETEDAAITPDQRQAERQDRHNHVDRELEHHIEFEQTRYQNQERGADHGDEAKAEKIERAVVHSPLRKKRPVMPCGSRRIRTMAAPSNATSPNTGVVTKVAI